MTAESRLKQYVLLVRLPNLFTVITNILVGYFSMTAAQNANPLQLSALVGSSILLYAAGIVFNDLFDLQIDKRERPSRPLPSGKISTRAALALGIVCLAAANVLAGLASATSLVMSLGLSAVILAYDYRLKHGLAGPVAMASARFLNVILGASPALSFAGMNGMPWNTLFPAAAMFAYVYAITLLSKREVDDGGNAVDVLRQSFSVIAVIITAVAVFLLYEHRPVAFLNLGLFSLLLVYTWRKSASPSLRGAQKVQNAIKNLVLFIIVLDSVFITAYAGLYYGLLSLALVPLPVLLARKLYVT